MKRADNHESPRFSMTLHNPSIVALGKVDEGANSKRRCSQKVIGTTFIGVGALLVLIAILYSTVLPSVIDDTIKSGVVTCNAKGGSKESYLDPYGDCDDCTPYYFSLYMFNVTNAEAHLSSNAKLQVQEVGPYVYRKRKMKLNVTFENDRVSYKEYSYFTFQTDMSCSGCSDQDNVVSYDVGYLNVISQAGGEYAFLTALAMGTFGKTLNASVIASQIQQNGPQMMRWVNGLNSLDTEAMKTVSSNSAVLMFLGTGPSVLQNLTMSGFAYNGVFAKRTIKQWALGYPSILAGLGLGSNYVNVCQAGGMEKQCASCTGNDCLKIYAQCKKCATGKNVVALNTMTCGTIEQIYAATHGATEAKTFAAGTCGLCSTLGLCAAPLPGAVATTGLDYSVLGPPSADTLGTYTQRTGCDDSNFIGEYEEYDGDKTSAIWSTLDSRRNPTSAEILAFASYGNCANPTANLTCAKVQGGDGTGVKPGGAGIHGFADEIPQKSISLYLDSIKFNISIVSADAEIDYEGITLHRFIAPTDLLTYTAEKTVTGTGFPVDGVQSLAFTSGFLAYLSYPVFLYGASSLTSGVEITMADGVVASSSTLYEVDGSVKTAYADKYVTYVDIEAGTGKTMRARKRLQASYAIAKSSVNASRPMTDVLWPTMGSEVIVPVYWGEESSTIKNSQVDSYKTIASLLSSMIPVLVVGLVVGVAVAAWGVVKRRRATQVFRAHASSII
ncbi:Croquemort-like mating, partial [Globisporangium splendens]